MTLVQDPPAGTARRAPAELLTVVAGLVCAAGLLFTSRTGDVGPLEDWFRGRGLLIEAVQWTAFGLAAALVVRSVRRRPSRILVVVLLAAVCQLPGLLDAPRNSSDAYRYVLDGRAQLAGISPYRYAPLDDHLARLRDPVLFPGLRPDQASGVTTPPGIPTDPGELHAATRNDPRTEINRPGVPTIYPPVAQAWFTVVALVTPWPAGTFGLQLASALLVLAVTAALGAVLRRRGSDPGWAILWGWSPLVVTESGNNAHVDVVAAALVVAAMVVLDRPAARARVVGGVLIGLAAATKVLPLLLLPAVTVLRHRSGGGVRWLSVPVAAVSAVLISYLPHVLVAGSLVLGYLPGYLNEEGFDSGTRYQVLALVLPTDLCRPAAALLTVALALAVLWRAAPERPELAALWLYGGFLLIATPSYPWYALPLVALLTLARRPEWVALVLVMQGAYSYLHSPGPVGGAYAVAGGVVLAATVWRARGRNMVTGPASGGVEAGPVVLG